MVPSVSVSQSVFRFWHKFCVSTHRNFSAISHIIPHASISLLTSAAFSHSLSARVGSAMSPECVHAWWCVHMYLTSPCVDSWKTLLRHRLNVCWRLHMYCDVTVCWWWRVVWCHSVLTVDMCWFQRRAPRHPQRHQNVCWRLCMCIDVTVWWRLGL